MAAWRDGAAGAAVIAGRQVCMRVACPPWRLGGTGAPAPGGPGGGGGGEVD